MGQEIGTRASAVWSMLKLGCSRNVRTSQGTFIARREDKQGVLAWMEDKIASLTGIPASHGEVRASRTT